MTKVSNCHDLPRANYKSQAPEPRQSKQNAAHPYASKIPPGKAEHRERKSQEQETELQKFKDDAALYLKLTGQENTILDNIQIRRENERAKWRENARKKYIQAPFMYDMIDFFRNRVDVHTSWKWEQKFTRTYHCRDAYQITPDGQALTYRCENRWCNSCSNMRAVRLRDRYQKPLSALREVWFVTLTGAAVKPGEDRLKERLKIYKKVWSRLIGRYKKRGDEQRIRGLRKLEIEISKNGKTFGYFHPHFHIITQGTEDFMQEFIFDWMYELGRNGIKASVKAQKAVRAKRDSVGNISMAELTKYVTKSMVEDPQTGELKHVSEEAFAEIWQSVQGIRLIHPIDIKGEAAQDEEEDGDSDHPTTTEAPPDAKSGHYKWNGSDWKGRPIDAPNDSEEISLTGHDAPTTHKHCAEMPDWLREQQNAVSRAISKAADRLKSKGIDVPLAVYEELPEPDPDTKKEGEP